MALVEFICPHCRGKSGSAKAIPEGALIRCPKCSQTFRPSAAVAKPPVKAVDSEPRSTKVTRSPAESVDSEPRSTKVTRSPAESTAAARRVDDEEMSDRPRKKKKKKSSSGNSNAIIGVAVGGVLVLALVIAVVVIVAVARGPKDSSPNVVATLSPSSARPGDQGGMSGGANAPFGGASGPGIPVMGPGSMTPMPGGGSMPSDGQPMQPNTPANPAPPSSPPDDRGNDSEAGPTAVVDPSTQDIKILVAPAPVERKSAQLRPVPASGQIDRTIVEKVKKATVLIRVETSAGNGSGSGFFAAGAPDMVLTNAHVVGMLTVDSPLPKSIEVVLSSGEKDEAIFRGEVLALDRSSDLAVLRIHRLPKSQTAVLPEPLSIATATQLFETQQIYIVGFPFGEQLGKNVTISPSSVTSLRKNPEGEFDQVQMGSGSHPGNSGGPVVDAGGNLVGVAVAGIPGTSINFAIPADRVASIMDGRLYAMQMREPVQKSGNYSIGVDVGAIDPLKKIATVSVDWWWGDAKDKVPAARGTPPPGATARQTVSLKVQGTDRWIGNLVMASKVPANKVLWVQPKFSSATEKDVYVQGVPKEIDSPPERINATLAFKPRAGRAKIELTSTNQLTFRIGGETKTLTMSIDSALSEDVTGFGGDGITTIQLGKREATDKFAIGLSLDGKEVRRSSQINKAVQSAGTMEMEIGMDRSGTVTGSRYRFQAAQQDKSFVEKIAGQFVQSLEFASVGLPNSAIAPGQKWHAQRKLPLNMEQEGSAGVPFYLTYTYRGIRRINGKRYGVLAITGRVDNSTMASGIAGTCSATALVDLDAGRISKYTGTIDSVFSLRFKDDATNKQEIVQARSRLVLKFARQ